MTDLSKTYRIPEARLEAVTKKLKTLNRKGEKLGTGAVSYELGKTEVVELRGEGDHPIFVRVVLLTVSGTTPAVSGYQFIGSITSAPGGNGNLFHGIPGQDKVSETIVNAPLTCDHCKTARLRKSTFLLKSETDGSILKVGRNCLADFLGGTDPEMVAATAEYLVQLEADLSEAEYLGADFFTVSTSLWDIESFLGLVIDELRTSEYKSRTEAKANCGVSTADVVLDRLSPPKGSGLKAEVPSQEDIERARELLQWVRSLQDDSDYTRNLRLLAEGRVVDRKTAGYVASIPTSYQRHLEREARDRLPTGAESSHVGTVGQRLDVSGTVTGRRTIESDSQWSDSLTLLKVVDDSGNVFSTFSSARLGIEWEDEDGSIQFKSAEVGTRVTLKGTVKGHSEFKGIKETQLSRVKILSLTSPS